MFIRCFSGKVYEVQQWPAVLQLENAIFSILSVYLEELRFLGEDDLREQIRSRLAKPVYPHGDVDSIANESFVADFLRENVGPITDFLSELPPGDHIPIEICVACNRDRNDVFMRCLEESPEFASSIEPSLARLEEVLRELDARLDRDELEEGK